ncbi:MAG: AEC family transporter [Erysipelotrichaceae bacterium]|nr:AEC family transporter [Erysipelotrichaceae bacterium]MDO5121197.1 AEC family transporter [Erysipelotrichaceae bacterium]
MEIGLLLLKQICVMFLLMLTGYVFYKRGMITDQGSKELGKILLYLVIPVVVINNFCIERTAEKAAELLQSTLLAGAAMLAAIVISHIVFGKRDGISCFSSAFSNAGFIGIPLVTAVMGSQYVFYISVMIVFVNALQWTYGVYVITSDKNVISPKKIMTNPIVLSVIAALIIFFSGIGNHMPGVVTSVFSSIAGLNTPIAMMVSGVFLAQSDLLAMFKKKKTYIVCLLRLVLIPLATLAVFRLLPFGSSEMKLALMIAAAAPVGSNVAVFAQAYDKNYTDAVEQVCLSTILCLLVLPLVITLASVVLG